MYVLLIINLSDVYDVLLCLCYYSYYPKNMHVAPELRCLSIREAQIYTKIAILIIIPVCLIINLSDLYDVYGCLC